MLCWESLAVVFYANIASSSFQANSSKESSGFHFSSSVIRYFSDRESE